MKIVFEIGPEKIAVGGVEFFLNQPKEVEDEIAQKILKKKTIVFKKAEEAPKPKAEGPKPK